MSELKILHDRIGSLARLDKVSGRHREIAGPESGSALDAIRLEIEETQLPRKLVFRNERGETLALNVASGRVMAFSEVHVAVSDAPRPALLVQEVSGENQPQISALFDTLCRFGHMAGKLFVESHILETKNEVSSVGVPAQKLFETCGDEPADRVPDIGENRLEQFLDHCAASTVASVRLDEDGRAHETGSGEYLEALRTLAKQKLSLRAEMKDEAVAPDNDCTVFYLGRESSHCVLCASSSTGHVFVLFAAAALDVVVRHWQKSGVRP